MPQQAAPQPLGLRRELTDSLRQLQSMPLQVGDLLVPAKDFLAMQVWIAVVHGKVFAPDGSTRTLDHRTWVRLVGWFYAWMEGSPPSLQFPDDGTTPVDQMSDEELLQTIING